MARRRHVLPSRSLRINARMLEHFDIDQVEIKSFSGADLSPKNEPTQLASVVPMVESQLENYSGNCHCGGFRFDISIPKLESVRVCDCSNCVRNGFLWISPVHTDNFVVSKGEGSLTTYQFASKTMSYMFCPKCGTSVMAVRHLDNGKDELGVNARALKDIDLSALKEVRYDGVSGKDSLPKYQPPTTFPSLELTSDDTNQGLTLYHGNCHCKAVTYTVKTKPFPDNKVMSCNCSLCSRNSDLWIYPKKSEVALSGAENLTDYVFLHEDSLHSFCKTCGVSVVVKVTSGDDIMPINVRTVDNIDVDKLKLKFYDGKSNKPEYKV
ncbi:Mss4-like protein [Bisporella sp. PMI_857]|nr:Mss4-like protein [Bisporella sp. PMI_857]